MARKEWLEQPMLYRYAVMLALIAVSLAVYWQAISNSFVNIDDYDYVVRNAHVQEGLTLESIRWAFTTTRPANWHPITWLSHMVDCQVYGLNPLGHHLTSVLLHVANTVLLFILLARMTGFLWRSAFVAALFALHPLHVESVAWVAERKDVLSTFFFLLTLLAYYRYVQRPGPTRYLAVILAFAVGLMAKPMLVTLPFALLLLDFWPLGRLSAQAGVAQEGAPPAFSRATVTPRLLLLEKAPFFLLSIASSIITVYAQKGAGAVASTSTVSLGSRLGNALVAYAAYLGKMVWPSELVVLYPLPAQVLPWHVTGAFLLLVCVTAAVWHRRRRSPYLAVGWLWYLGTLVPVIGLVQVGVQAMADRYTYIPLIGIFIMIAWWVPERAQEWRHSRAILAASAVATLCALSLVSWKQVGYWRNSEELFAHALRYTSGNFTAHTSMGIALAERGLTDEAIGHYREALRINPSYELAHVYLAIALTTQGKIDEAISQYLKLLRLKPDSATAHNNLGIVLSMKGETAEAIDHFSAAARIDPEYADAHYNLALALTKQGRLEEAVPHYLEAQRINPADADILRNLEIAQSQLDRARRGRNR